MARAIAKPAAEARYSREEIPPLFGLESSTAIWNAGFVKRPGHIFLLATLDKSGHGVEFKYKDRFVSRSEFEWQSQNRTGQASADGQDIARHAERGIAVHLFIRAQKKRAGEASAPFVYCGDVSFAGWEEDKPITVKWMPSRIRLQRRLAPHSHRHSRTRQPPAPADRDEQRNDRSAHLRYPYLAPFRLAHSTAYPSASAFWRTRVPRVTTTINGGGSPSNSVVAKCTASSVRIGSTGNGLRTRARTASVTPTR